MSEENVVDQVKILDDNGKPVDANLTISLDDDIDAGDEFHELSKALEDTVRYTDVAVALEELIQITEEIKEAKPTDIYLVENNLRATLAGTNTEVEEVVPNLESYVGSKISNEGIVAFLKTVLKSIQAFIIKIWNGFIKFLKKIFGSSTRIRIQAKRILAASEQMGTRAPNKQRFDVGSEIVKLNLGYKAPTNGGELLLPLRVMDAVLHNINTKMVPQLLTIGGELVNGFNNFKVDKPTESLVAINAATHPLTFSGDPSAVFTMHPVKSDPRFGAGTFSSNYLPANLSIFLQRPIEGYTADRDTPVWHAHAFRSTRYTLEPSRDKGPKPVEKMSIEAMQPHDVASVAKAVIAICDKIDEFETSLQSKLYDERVKIDKAIIHMTETVGDNTNSDVTECYKSAVRYASTFAIWSTNIQAACIRLSIQASSSALIVCQKALKNLEEVKRD